MNVLFLNSNTTHCARSGYGLTPAPAGLISLAGVLGRRGHEVKIRQVHAHVWLQDDEDLPLLRKELQPILQQFTPDVVGISARNVGAARKPANPFELVQYYSVYYDARLVTAVRMLCGAPVVIGGTAFSIAPELYMRYARPDYGLMGEAEGSLAALLDAVASGREPVSIPGLLRGTAEAWEAGGCARAVDLAAVGAGACDAVEDFAAEYYEGGGFAPVQTKRGCAMNCIYCTAPFLEGHSYRFRPLSCIIEEISAYKRLWGVRHFFFVDNTFNHPLEHATEVCNAMLEADLDVEWFAEVTPAVLTDELCRMMVRSGCIGVTLTPDSCSEAVLRAYRKGFGMAEVKNAIDLLKKHSIPFDTCLIVGGPGETPETFQESLAFCHEHLSDRVVRFYDGMVITTNSGAFELAVGEGLVDPARRYEDLVLENDFRAVRRYEYFFPHVRQGRQELLDLVAKATRRRHWLLTSKDYMVDPVTGEMSLSPEVVVQRGARPWWRGLCRRADAGA